MCFLAKSSWLSSCVFSKFSFLKSGCSSFLVSAFSLVSEVFSFSGLSSNFSNASLRVFTSLSISSWVISLLSKALSARDKIRLSSFTDFSVFLLISVFLILSTRSFNSFLLTSFFTGFFVDSFDSDFSTSLFSAAFSISWFCIVFSIVLSLEPSTDFSFSRTEVLSRCFSPVVLSTTPSFAITSELFISLACTTCEPLILIPPTTKNNEQPKRICFPFFTIRQFFCWSPCLLNNIFSLLIFLT